MLGISFFDIFLEFLLQVSTDISSGLLNHHDHNTLQFLKEFSIGFLLEFWYCFLWCFLHLFQRYPLGFLRIVKKKYILSVGQQSHFLVLCFVQAIFFLPFCFCLYLSTCSTIESAMTVICDCKNESFVSSIFYALRRLLKQNRNWDFIWHTMQFYTTIVTKYTYNYTTAARNIFGNSFKNSFRYFPLKWIELESIWKIFCICFSKYRLKIPSEIPLEISSSIPPETSSRNFFMSSFKKSSRDSFGNLIQGLLQTFLQALFKKFQ